MISSVLFGVLLCLSLYGRQRVELVTNGICHTEQYAWILEKYQKDCSVHDCDLSTFRGIKKNDSFLGKLFTKTPHQIPVSSDVRKIVFMNIHHSPKKFRLDKLPKDRMVLFMWEPPIRLNRMYSDSTQRCFSKIYTWNDDLVDNHRYFKLYYPNRRPMLETIPSFEEKELCTLIVGATNDKSRSFPNELYSHRIRAIRFFEEKEPGFAFYGRNWDPHQFPSYRGPVEDKIAVNKRYKFTICYENCAGLPGYITEKIFDCFAAGSVPIYWGASNIETYIPKSCFIDRREFATLDELYLFLKAMSKETYESYLENIRAYLKSEQSEVFSPEHYEKTVLEALDYCLF